MALKFVNYTKIFYGIVAKGNPNIVPSFFNFFPYFSPRENELGNEIDRLS